MRRPSSPAASRIVLAGMALAAALVVVSCAREAPEQRVARLRANYEANLNSFNVHETPVAVDSTVVAAAPGEAVDTATTPQAAETAEPAPVPVRQDVALDIMLRNKNKTGDRLPGLTLDVTQADAAENPKATYKIYVDTSKVPPGSRNSVTYMLEDVDFAPGDRFNVELRQAVPPEERDQYKEFEAAADQG